ncbi:nucleotidyltransferase family protein [Sneathiella sp. CAU 1612]|uniref:Nucleotidyltransferase family protein n=1 Tax=Sneathiella sedimenti TaxID=2816034 RepID=A0ABS3F483_9PROT|nr:nucleotidyltransferase family protein [Sneathiella sedimenti]MBO0333337.1 nucleotidyltransferase family protein [Sneathiella sedimenti]
MEALLLAAGLGTRLQPLTSELPKCLMPIHGRPLLGLWLEMLISGGIDRIFINLHYLAPLVREYVSTSPYARHVRFLEEPELLGTAGTLKTFRKEYSDNALLMAHADNLTLFDVREFRRSFENRPKDCALTMMTFETDDPQSCGIVTLDKEKRVIDFVEKPKTDIGRLANGAVYIMDIAAIDRILKTDPEITDFSTEILPHFVGHMNSFHNHLYHRDIGNVTALADAQKEIRDRPQAQALISAVPSYWSMEETRQLRLRQFQACLATTSVDAAAITLMTEK